MRGRSGEHDRRCRGCGVRRDRSRCGDASLRRSCIVLSCILVAAVGRGGVDAQPICSTPTATCRRSRRSPRTRRSCKPLSVRLIDALFDNVDVESSRRRPSRAGRVPRRSARRRRCADFVDDAILRFLADPSVSRRSGTKPTASRTNRWSKALTGGGPVISTEDGRGRARPRSRSSIACAPSSRPWRRHLRRPADRNARAPLRALRRRLAREARRIGDRACSTRCRIVLPILVVVFGVAGGPARGRSSHA